MNVITEGMHLSSELEKIFEGEVEKPVQFLHHDLDSDDLGGETETRLVSRFSSGQVYGCAFSLSETKWLLRQLMEPSFLKRETFDNFFFITSGQVMKIRFVAGYIFDARLLPRGSEVWRLEDRFFYKCVT